MAVHIYIKLILLMMLFHTGKCSTPMDLTNALTMGYNNPALEGQIITFTCPPGQILNGSNTSTCMGNGEWEPDPREVECTGISVSTTTTTVPTMILLGTIFILTLVPVMSLLHAPFTTLPQRRGLSSTWIISITELFLSPCTSQRISTACVFFCNWILA